ncbi:cell wall mannoprotein 1 family protein, partial [Aspergillus ruber CBS 135680]
MKFSLSLLTTLALSANVLATATVEARGPTRVGRDLASITGVLSGISDKVGSLHTAINNFNGGDTQPVESASDSLVDAINSGTTKVNGGDELNSMDALGLQKPVSDLKDKIQSTISDLNSKKQKIVDAGKGSLTYNDLQKQKTAALKLSDAIVSKVPENLHDIAHSLASGISDAIQKGVEDFEDVA